RHGRGACVAGPAAGCRCRRRRDGALCSDDHTCKSVVPGLRAISNRDGRPSAGGKGWTSTTAGSPMAIRAGAWRKGTTCCSLTVRSMLVISALITTGDVPCACSGAASDKQTANNPAVSTLTGTRIDVTIKCSNLPLKAFIIILFVTYFAYPLVGLNKESTAP